MNSINLLGIRIHNLTSAELNHEIDGLVRSGGKHIVANVNIHAMNIAHSHEWFKDFLNHADINFCDGDGVRLGAQIRGLHIAEKITYNRWIWDFLEFCEQSRFSCYFLGSEESTISKAVEIVKQKYPRLEILGWRSGYFDAQNVESECVQEISSVKPNVLVLGMGMPMQEKWLIDNRSDATFNVALTGGAVFEYVSGRASMTPDIFYKLKLEWLYRFFKDPARLFRRYFVGNPAFFWRVFTQKN